MEFRFFGQRMVMGTGLVIPTNLWNTKKMRVKTSSSFLDYSRYNRKLDNLDSSAKDTLRSFEDESVIPTVNQFRLRLQKLVNGSNRNESKKLIEYLDHRIEETRKTANSKSAIDHLTRIRTRVRAFIRHDNFHFEDVSKDFIGNFIKHLYSKNYQQNYVRDIVRRLYAVMRKSHDDGLHSNKIFLRTELIPTETPSDMIYLSTDDLKQLYEFDFSSTPKLERVRDIFIVQCDTGLRYNDLKQLDKLVLKTVQNIPMIQVFTRKTDQEVIIPQSRRTKEILTKYSGFPRVISNQKMNDYLKEVCTLAGIDSDITIRKYHAGVQKKEVYKKWELIGTHTARRTFATNAILEGSMPKMTIMIMTGHKSEKTFDGYVRVDSLTSALQYADTPFFNQ